MLVWQGYGLLAIGPPLAILIGMQVLVDAIGGRGTYTNASALFGGIALILSSPPTWALARWLDRRTPARDLVDAATGQSVVLRNHHRFFFVEIGTWAKIWAIGGAIFLLVWMAGRLGGAA